LNENYAHGKQNEINDKLPCPAISLEGGGGVGQAPPALASAGAAGKLRGMIRRERRMTSAWSPGAGAGALLLALAAPALAAPPRPAPKAKIAPQVRINPLGCAVPIARADSARALQRRFGDNAAVSSRPDERGVQVYKVVLYPDEPARRIEVLYPDAAMRVPLRVKIDRLASTWSLAGLRVGDSLAAAVSRNRGPFVLRGFAPGEGGQVSDWQGGALAASMPGGCTVGVRFVAPLTERVAERATGAARLLRSDQPEVLAAEPIVAELSISWPTSPEPARKRK
jgi:hypothetical protein